MVLFVINVVIGVKKESTGAITGHNRVNKGINYLRLCYYFHVHNDDTGWRTDYSVFGGGRKNL